jgi:hypothetical protein
MRFTHRTLIVSATTCLGLLASQSGALAQIGSARTGCNSSTLPGAEEVIIYMDNDYRGDCRILSVGTYPTASNFGLPNDSISSLKIGSNVQAHLFWDGPFDVHNTEFGWVDFVRRLGGNYPNLGAVTNAANTGQGWNDATSSMRVIRNSEACANPGPKQVVFFQHADFWGDCVTKNVGFFDVWDIGMMNDSITSLKVGSSATLTICKNGNFGTPCDVYRPGSTVSNLGDAPVGNDSISSAAVQ